MSKTETPFNASDVTLTNVENVENICHSELVSESELQNNQLQDEEDTCHSELVSESVLQENLTTENTVDEVENAEIRQEN